MTETPAAAPTGLTLVLIEAMFLGSVAIEPQLAAGNPAAALPILQENWSMWNRKVQTILTDNGRDDLWADIEASAPGDPETVDEYRDAYMARRATLERALPATHAPPPRTPTIPIPSPS